MSDFKPRILFVTHDAGRTGAPIGLLAFMRWLRAGFGWEMTSLLRSPGPLEPEFRSLGPATTLGNSFWSRNRIGRRLGRFLPRSVQNERGRIRRLFSENAFDLIYSNTVTNGSVLRSVCDFGVPVVTHVHELEYWIWRSGPANLRDVKACTHHYIAASKAVQENLVHKHGIAASAVSVIYEHIRELPSTPTAGERAAARSELGIPQDAFVVGGCGAEHWRKGKDLIPQLLVALNRRQEGAPIHFVWVGRQGLAEDEYELMHDLRTAGVDAQFHSTGELADPFRIFASIDVFALLSRDDPYPLACLEVAGTGVPVVCFAGAGGMPEFVNDGCGYVVPYLEMESMAQAIVHLAGDPLLARRLGERAREKVGQENTLATTGPQLKRVMESVLKLRTGETPSA